MVFAFKSTLKCETENCFTLAVKLIVYQEPVVL